MNHINPDSSEWKPCPAGVLVEMQKQVHDQEQTGRRRLFKAASVQVVVLMLGTLLIHSIDTTPHSHLGEITCNEVQTAIMNGQFQSLDDKAKSRVQRHLQKCPHCKEAIHQLQKGEILQTVPCLSFSEVNLHYLKRYRFTVGAVHFISSW